MFTNKVSINYKGFHPSDNTQEIMGNLLQELLLEGPSFSRMNAHIVKEGLYEHALYKGSIEIHSNAGNFFIRAESSQIADMAHKLLKRSRKNFSKWKEKRLGHREKIQSLSPTSKLELTGS